MANGDTSTTAGVHGGGGGKAFILKVKPRADVKELIPSKDATITSQAAVFLMYASLAAYTIVILLGEAFFLPQNEAEWCEAARRGYSGTKRYENPDCNNNPCFRERPWQLLFMSQMECDFARRILLSVVAGAAIGFERKAAERPAGIRTMSLVCLGSCFFTMCSQIAFRSSTMGWDAARVSAAIPSGVGFLGSALIWKGTIGEKGSPDERPEVHGLTTAASVWLSAAVGIGVGGRLTIVSIYAVALVILVLRLGPRMYFTKDSQSFCDSESELGFDSASSESNVSESDGEEDAGNFVRPKKISSEEQMRLLMGLSAGDFYGDNQGSLSGGVSFPSMASISDLRRFKSTPNLQEMHEVDTVAESETYVRSNSAPQVAEQYEVPLKDDNINTPHRRRKGRRKGRRRHRSLSPRRRAPRFLS